MFADLYSKVQRLLNWFPITTGSLASSVYATTAEIADVADTESAGTSATVARGDHVHDLGQIVALAHLTSGLYTDTSYTPSLAGDSTAGSQTYSQRVGNYIRFGGFVVVWFNVVLSAKDGTTAGAMYVSLPLTSRNTTNLIGAGIIYAYGNVDFTAGYTHLNAYVLPNDNKLYFSQAGDNVAGANVTAAAIGNSTIIRGCAIYPV